ncbi:MAG: outer membrane lipoprotein LolB [Xanthomonadales bacterium]|nr:outer membrane lipoprotein LolB [Xanthomonadales bacterium]|tara:strand:+ start:1610 stop:2239 length:630 start_codon:yes stop_codon:yes gene_type:complete
MKRFIAVATTLMAMAAVLPGCAIITKPDQRAAGIANGTAWQAHRAELADLTTWSLQGRVATGQLLGWTGNLSWRERGEHFDVRLAGPLGAGGMRAQGTLDQVTIDTDKGEHLVTRQPDVLVERTLGWSFPLAPLRYWVRGLPAPGDYARISVGEDGRLQSITQDGWRVSYQAYTTPIGAPSALPRKIVLDNDETRIRLVVDRWFDLDTP